LLLAEPAGHVSEARFDSELGAAVKAGLRLKDRPTVKRCLAAVLAKEDR
jgi:hypothetical protein